MQYRKFGNTGYEISALSMGCMRLPFIDENDGSKGVQRDKAYELIRYAVDNGVNYFDTAFGYHGGTSEEVLGEALEGGRREKVKISTKQPFWQMPERPEIRRRLEATLKKLRTSYIDFLFIHGIGAGNWPNIQEQDIYGELEKFKAEGLIRHIGFSFHGNLELFKEVAARHPWAMCMVQHNMMDLEREVTAEGIRFAHEKGIAVAAMEPLLGGGLAHAPGPVGELYKKFPKQRKAVEWALRYLVDQPGVSSVCSGMSTMEQLKENIAIFSQPDMVANCLSAEEKQLISEAREAYKSVVTINCTECRYCEPCPQNVDIPGTLSLFNAANRYGHFDQPRRSYMFSRRGKRSVLECNNCGICSTKCPQELDIPKELQVAHAALEGWEE